MKKFLMILTLMLCVFILTGCVCEHTWQDADCTVPKTCSNCGETEGSPLGHSWLVPTCTNPKMCERCGLAEGEAPGHDWTEATHYAPKTCKVCGSKEGESIPHAWAPATYYFPETCKVCKTTNGDPLPRYDRDEFFINITGFEKLYRELLEPDGYILWEIDPEETGMQLDPSTRTYVLLDEDYVGTNIAVMVLCDEQDVVQAISLTWAQEGTSAQNEKDLAMDLCLRAYQAINPKTIEYTPKKFLADTENVGMLFSGQYDGLSYEIVEFPQLFSLLIVPENAVFQESDIPNIG